MRLNGQQSRSPLLEVQELGPWFHNLHLPGGMETAPHHRFGDFPAWKWQHLAPHIPEDLTGWRALDLGCNAGFYSFELAKRGADVVAIDHDEHYLRQARWAAEKLDPEGRIRFENLNIYGLSTAGSFDLVLFMGVFYHLRYPLLVLDTIAQMSPELMVFQTLTMPGEEVSEKAPQPFDFAGRDRMSEAGWPHMAFIEGDFSNDPTNWWAPNRACVHSLLRNTGFSVVAEPTHEFFICRRAEDRPPSPTWLSEWQAATHMEDRTPVTL